LLRRHDGALFVTEVKHFPESEFSEFTILTADRPGLFAKIAGVLLAHGMNILTASINTSLDGVALDVFRISHGDSPEVAMRPARWERIQESLQQVLSDHLDVETLVEQSRPASILGKKWVPRVPTKIEIDNDVSAHYTVLDIYTQDRVGLLFTITSTLYRLGLSIHIAKISTNVDQVLDVFYVTDTQGAKLTDGAQLARTKEQLAQRLAVTEEQPAEQAASTG
jgi:[protein-PII] uridylyltransferase